MKAKKILGIVVVALFTLLACLVVVSYFVPKNFSLPIEAPQRILVYDKDGTSHSIEKTDEKYDKIMELYNKGLNIKFIEAFFQGKGFNSISTVENSSSLSSLKSSDSKFYIEFVYGTEQETKIVNGKNLELTTEESTYRAVVIEIINSNNITQMNAFIRRGTESNNGSNIRYVSYARHAKLFSYLNELYA